MCYLFTATTSIWKLYMDAFTIVHSMRTIYFGLITIEQKPQFTEECMLMNPNEFIAMVQAMTLENGFDSFIHLKRLRLSCGSDDACDRIMSCIVSIVSLETHTQLSKNNNVVKSDFDSFSEFASNVPFFIRKTFS